MASPANSVPDTQLGLTNDEIALLRTHSVCAVVSRNSGGTEGTAKLRAARQLGLLVIMIEPPAPPAGVRSVETVDEVLALLDHAR